MELTLPLIALPAVVALILKAAVYVYTRISSVTRNLETRLFLLFLLFLAIQNVAEISGLYSLNVNGVLPYFAAKLFYASVIAALAPLFHLALSLACDEQHWARKIGPSFIYLSAVVLEILLISPSWLIQDFEILDYGIGFSVTRVPGPLYALFEFYVIGIFCGVLGLSLYGSRKKDTGKKRVKNSLLMIAIAPIAIVALLALGLLHFGIRWINWSVTFPIMITYFLIVTANAIHNHRFLDTKLRNDELVLTRKRLIGARRQLHAFEERVVRLQAQNQLLLAQKVQSTNDALPPSSDPTDLSRPLDDDVAEFEARLIARALKRCQGNKAQAARLLGLRPNTLHYKIERYGLSDEKRRK